MTHSKKISYLHFLFLLLTAVGYSQLGERIYVDSTFAETNSDNYQYYRIIEKSENAESYIMKYFYKSDAIYSEGTVTNPVTLRRSGQYNFYYENGNKKEAIFFQNNEPSGSYKSWYEDGSKKQEATYISAQKNKMEQNWKIDNFWLPDNTQSVVDGNGFHVYTYDQLNQKGAVKNGLRNGKWIGEHKKLKFTFTDNYHDGTFVSGTSVDSLFVERKYTSLTVTPEPKKGLQSFYKHIAKKIKIPNLARNTSGTIVVEFTVNPDGQPSDFRIRRGLGLPLDEEAIRVIRSYSGWTPGMIRGIKVNVKFTIPITIKPS